MLSIDIFKINGGLANINILRPKRSWMDNTFDMHAYRCLPVSLANTLGWEISFPEDISFIWDGISDSSESHVKVLSGKKYTSTGRANGTISFRSGFIIKSNQETTIMHAPVPNYFIDGVQAFTTLISTSFYDKEFPLAMMITRPNKIITIKAGTPVINLIPVSLSELNNSIANIYDLNSDMEYNESLKSYDNVVSKNALNGKWSDFYRNATDEFGNKLGSHEVKSIKFNLIDNSKG